MALRELLSLLISLPQVTDFIHTCRGNLLIETFCRIFQKAVSLVHVETLTGFA